MDSINQPLRIQKTFSPIFYEKIPFKNFSRFSSFYKTQELYYVFQRIIFGFFFFLERSRSLQSKEKPSFMKEDVFKKKSTIMVKSFIEYHYLNARFKNSKIFDVPLKFQCRNFSQDHFDSIQSLLNFEILQKQWEFFNVMTDLRKMKLYWSSLLSYLQESFIQKFHLLFGMHHFTNDQRKNVSPNKSNLTRNLNKVEDGKMKHLEFYFYKNLFYRLLSYLPSFTPLPFSPSIHSNPVNLNDLAFQLKGSNLSETSDDFHSSIQLVNFSQSCQKMSTTYDKWIEFITFYFKVNTSELEEMTNQHFLSQLFRQSNRHEMIWKTKHSLAVNKLLPLSNENFENSYFSTMPTTNLLFFDKLNKYGLFFNSCNESKIQKLPNIFIQNSLHILEFRKLKLYSGDKLKRLNLHMDFGSLSCKLKKVFSMQFFRSVHSKIDSIVYFNSLNSNDWSANRVLPLVSAFDFWMKKNQIQVFTMNIFSSFVLLKLVYPIERFPSQVGDNQDLRFSNFILPNSRLIEGFDSKVRFVNYLKTLKHVIKKHSSSTQVLLINKLTLKLLTNSYFLVFTFNRSLFKKLDRQLNQFLWKWALRRHNNKSHLWIQRKYFISLNLGGVRTVHAFSPTWIFGSFLEKNLKTSKEKFLYLPTHLQLFESFLTS